MSYDEPDDSSESEDIVKPSRDGITFKCYCNTCSKDTIQEYLLDDYIALCHECRDLRIAGCGSLFSKDKVSKMLFKEIDNLNKAGLKDIIEEERNYLREVPDKYDKIRRKLMDISNGKPKKTDLTKLEDTILKLKGEIKDKDMDKVNLNIRLDNMRRYENAVTEKDVEIKNRDNTIKARDEEIAKLKEQLRERHYTYDFNLNVRQVS